jgi:DNA polymerase I-like protein with 3'-5' exonuclease and polymerase domains
MKLVVDVENTVTKRDGKMHLDPFEPSNKLVMVGCLDDRGNEYLFNMDGTYQNNYDVTIQELLNQATILIGHNIAYDLMWLWESGFKYDGPIFCTMLTEYVLQRGIKEPLHLKDCAERYDLETKKEDTLKNYFAQGFATDEIPRAELSSYLSADLHATQQLSDKQYYRLNTPKDAGLMNTVLFTNKVSVALAKIYKRGFKVDVDTLESVQQEFQNEKSEIEKRLQGQVKELMGDTPINLNSPEQMSWILYSRKPKDKSTWMNNFAHAMEKSNFNQTIKDNTDIVYKTKAQKCRTCIGSGIIRKVKKDGTLYARLPKCPDCNGNGYSFISVGKVAGFKFNPPNVKWVSANGFSVNKKMLEVLQHVTKRNDSVPAFNFLTDIQRLSALDTYLSSFVEGIKIHTKTDGMLHVRLLQHRTSTGRFSGADPNMQNMPRGGTFPVKKVFVSRWQGGKILEADFAQLEFRTAAYLSQDKTAMKEIQDGFDVHAYTASVITESGQKITRQEAKAHTFAPLYGATGFGRTTSEAKYYEQFTKKYKEIALWHTRLAKEALNTQKIKIPSGREFSFPDVKRRTNGGVSHFTQIKNYPVQSFATADIVPLVLLAIDDQLQNFKSCIVNTVHDSIVIDVHPSEERNVIDIINNTNENMKAIIDTNYGIDFNVPLLLEAKIGDNWLDTKDVS